MSIFILIGEMEGDYNDQYQRYREVLRVCNNEETLQAFANGAPYVVREDGVNVLEKFFYVDGVAYIALDIEEADEMTELESNAYDIGYVAFLSQKQKGVHRAPADVPGSAWRTLWERGWKDAEKENSA